MLDRLRRVGAWLVRHREVIGKTVLVLALLVVSALPAVVDNTVIGYLPVLLVASLVVLMGIYMAVLARCVTFDAESGVHDCQRGDTAQFTVSVTNRSILLVPRVDVCLYLSNLFGGVDSSLEESFSLMPRETKDFRMEVRFTHIGQYRAGLHSLVIHDAVGLFSHRFAVGAGRQVTVLPRLVPLSHVSAVQELAVENQRVLEAVISDGMDYAGMRDYVVGDPFKSIHWKASARFERYLTRLFETQINPSMCVVLDGRTCWKGDERQMQAYDAVVEAALAFDAYARENGFDHSLLFPSVNGGYMRRALREHHESVDVVRHLPRLYDDESPTSAGLMIRQELFGRYAASSVVVCTADLSQDLFSTLVELKGAGKSPALFFACPDDLSDKERRGCQRKLASLAASQIPSFMFCQAEELRGGAW